MAITLDGTNGITTPDVDTDGLAVDTNTLFVDAANNRVGVGTSSPAQPLDVNGNVAITGAARRITGDFSDATHVNRVSFQTNVTNGATSPFFIPNGTGNIASVVVASAADPTNSSFGQLLVVGGSDVRVASGILGSGTALPLAFHTNGSERARIDTSGKFFVNTTTGVGGFADSARLHAVHTQHGASFQTTAASGFAAATFSRNNNNGAACEFFFTPGSVAVGNISITSSATAYNTSSDYRLKEDVKPMVGASDRLMALKPVNFAWKVDGSRVDGFLAHEVQAFVPECVTGQKDEVDDEGNPVYQGIDQSKLTPLLTAALQEALQKIEALEARISALETSA